MLWSGRQAGRQYSLAQFTKVLKFASFYSKSTFWLFGWIYSVTVHGLVTTNKYMASKGKAILPIGLFFSGVKPYIPCRSLLLSTIVLNDIPIISYIHDMMYIFCLGHRMNALWLLKTHSSYAMLKFITNINMYICTMMISYEIPRYFVICNIRFCCKQH